MKKLISYIVSFFLTSVCLAEPLVATPIEVAQECHNQMSIGICKVPVDRSMLAPGQTMLMSGVGRVSMSALADYTDLYNPVVPTDPAMCDLALHYMTEEPDSDHDKIARAYWTPLKKINNVSVLLSSASDLANKAIQSAKSNTLVLLATMLIGLGMLVSTIFSKRLSINWFSLT